MPIFDLDNMDSRKRTLYSSFWGKEIFPFELNDNVEIKQTIIDNNKISVNSYSFYDKNGNDTKDSTRLTLEKVFDINDTDQFKVKYDMAVSGSGNEYKRITTLHSSSLCALMFFYNVTDNNPLNIPLNTINNKGRNVKFTESYFEYQSKVLDNPSNMDVVLVGEDTDSHEKIVFFLESKFSEYYIGAGKKLNVPRKYLWDCPATGIYNKLLNAEGFKEGESTQDGYFALESDVSCYLEGVKQIISHYCGAVNDLEKDLIPNQGKYRDKVSGYIREPETKLVLGEIIFDERIKEFEIRSKTNPYNEYKKKYRLVAEIISEDIRERGLDGRFEILNDVLDYSMIAKSGLRIEPNIRKFYGF